MKKGRPIKFHVYALASKINEFIRVSELLESSISESMFLIFLLLLRRQYVVHST